MMALAKMGEFALHVDMHNVRRVAAVPLSDAARSAQHAEEQSKLETYQALERAYVDYVGAQR